MTFSDDVTMMTMWKLAFQMISLFLETQFEIQIDIKVMQIGAKDVPQLVEGLLIMNEAVGLIPVTGQDGVRDG